MKRVSFSSFMLVAGLLFIYLPMLILVIYSFNESKLVTVWGGWSIKWYVGLLDNTQLMGSVARSLEIACYTAVAAVALGTLAAFVLTRISHVREQGVGLEHHVDRPLVGRHISDVHAVEVDATFGGALKACEHAQQGGFARTRTAEQGEYLAFLDFQGHIVHGNRLVELLRDPVDFDQHLFRCLVALEGFLIGAGGNCHLRNSQKKECSSPEVGEPWIVRALLARLDLGPATGH